MLPDNRMTLGHEDASRLRSLLEQTSHRAERRSLDQLETELDRARLVDTVPGDIVTVGRRVAYRRVPDGPRQEVTLVYPEDADIAQRRVSVLSPVGAALLGLRVGAEIGWPLPKGKTGRFIVLEVTDP